MSQGNLTRPSFTLRTLNPQTSWPDLDSFEFSQSESSNFNNFESGFDVSISLNFFHQFFQDPTLNQPPPTITVAIPIETFYTLFQQM